MEILALIIKIVLVVFSVFLAIVVLLQSGAKQGLSGAIAGGAEQLFGKKKSKGYDAILEKVTVIGAVVFIIVALILVTLG